MRFSQVVKPTVRFGAVFRCREPYGPVRYVLQSGSVRFSDIVQTCGAVVEKENIVRCGALRLTATNRTETTGKTAP